jgi:alpha/beta superfamily hydrolase
MSFVKSGSVLVIRGVSGHYVGGESMSRGFKTGAVLAVGSYVAPRVVSAIPAPSIWAFMQGQADNVVASVLSSLVKALWMKNEGSKGKAFLRELLYSFGSCVAADFVVPMIPSYGATA